MKLENELAECEAEVAELRHQVNKLTLLIRNIAAEYRNGNEEVFRGLLLLAEDV